MCLTFDVIKTQPYNFEGHCHYHFAIKDGSTPIIKNEQNTPFFCRKNVETFILYLDFCKYSIQRKTTSKSWLFPFFSFNYSIWLWLFVYLIFIYESCGTNLRVHSRISPQIATKLFLDICFMFVMNKKTSTFVVFLQ